MRRMMAERGLEAGAAAGSVRRTVLSQWATIAPELHGKVQAVQYDPATRTLHLRPCSPAYRTQLTLHQRELVTRVNATASADTVTALKILPPGTTDLQERLNHDPAVQPPAAPAARPPADRQQEPRPRDPGYLAALTAHQQTWDGRQETDPVIRAKEERQIRDRIREPEHRFVEGRRAQAGRRAALDAADRSASSDAARARALKRLAEERAAVAPTAAALRASFSAAGVCMPDQGWMVSWAVPGSGARRRAGGPWMARSTPATRSGMP
ncbi:DciA family protein [Streptomyces cyaneofuscatus]|uniref:DciA family protein n=1 Tax=Streptomyces cyaneofuscatus TaxID=66883 RepID=UPI0037AF7022